MKHDGPDSLPFFKYGRDPQCDPEIAHSIVELIDRVESEFVNNDGYWGACQHAKTIQRLLKTSDEKP